MMKRKDLSGEAITEDLQPASGVDNVIEKLYGRTCPECGFEVHCACACPERIEGE
ncbi:hypothetical protein [Nocardia sp. NPDC050435]|uniref:hypothetical protein n=1 Tax=Nocardia sp. NPDC050435 TaxID=3155040 RepID=UPI0033FFFCFA